MAWWLHHYLCSTTFIITLFSIIITKKVQLKYFIVRTSRKVSQNPYMWMFITSQKYKLKVWLKKKHVKYITIRVWEICIFQDGSLGQSNYSVWKTVSSQLANWGQWNVSGSRMMYQSVSRNHGRLKQRHNVEKQQRAPSFSHRNYS